MTLQKVNFEKGIKKTAIVSLSITLSYSAKAYDLKSKDLYFLREFLLKIKNRNQVDFVTKKTKTNPEYFFKDFHSTDLNDYDEVIIHNSSYNTFFGGVVGEVYEQTLLLLSKYKGEIWYYLIDPRFGYTDYGKYLKERMLSKSNIKFSIGKITTDDCDRFSENITPNIKCIYAGINYETHFNYINKNSKNMWSKEIINKWDSIPIHEFWAANMINCREYEPKYKKYDIIYYGVNRKSDRNKLLDSLFKKDEYFKKLWVGYNPEYLNTFVSEFVPRDQLEELMESSYISIVAGDKLHFANMRTLRFFESLAMNTIGLIYSPYEGRILIKNKKLSDFLNFNTLDDIKYKLDYLKNENFYREIIELQKEEFRNQTSIYKLDNALTNMNKLKIKSLF